MDYLVRYKEILKEEGLSGMDVYEFYGGLTYDSYRSLTRSGSLVVPKWVRGFVLGYELGIQKKSTASGIDGIDGVD